MFKDQDKKHIATLAATLISVVIAYWAFAAGQRARDREIHTQIHLNTEKVEQSIKVSDKNRITIHNIQDKLSNVPTKTEFIQAFHKQEMLYRNDFITLNGKIYTLNGDVSNLQGAMKVLYTILDDGFIWSARYSFNNK